MLCLEPVRLKLLLHWLQRDTTAGSYKSDIGNAALLVSGFINYGAYQGKEVPKQKTHKRHYVVYCESTVAVDVPESCRLGAVCELAPSLTGASVPALVPAERRMARLAKGAESFRPRASYKGVWQNGREMLGEKC